MTEKQVKTMQLPCGELCGYNCADKWGCAYWNPSKRDFNGRQYCSYYGSYYFPSERQGCLSYK